MRRNFVLSVLQVFTFAVIDRLKTLRGPGESYSDVIVRVARG